MAWPSKSCCLDALATALLKKTLPVHLPVLCKITNMSLEKGIFPGRLKAADVTTIIKKSSLDQNVLLNLSQHCLNEPLQSAYRPQHSTQTALMKVQHDIA